MTARLQSVMQQFLRSFDTKPELHHVKSVLVLTHGSPSILLGRLLQQQPEANVKAYTAAVSSYRRLSGDGTLGLWQQEWNCRSDYLSQGKQVRITLNW